MPAARAPKKKIRILIADREGVFRLGLRKLFSLEDDLRVVAQAENDVQIPGLCQKFKPDVLFVQAELAGSDLSGFLVRVRRAWPAGKTIVVAPALGEGQALSYVKAGAAGVILKSDDPTLFIQSIRKVLRNDLWLPEGHATEAPKPRQGGEPAPVRPVDTLTRRERTIISCLMQGWRNREIADHLHITEQTVKNHLRTIFDKVGVSDRLELALYAIHQRLELPPLQVGEAPA